MLSIRWKVLGIGAAIGVTLNMAGLRSFAVDVAKGTENAGENKTAEADTATVPAAKLPSPIAKAESAEQEITLTIGKPAPPLAVTSWVKGEPLDGLKPGQVYVVEFWATWCGPCLAGMPHISALQTEYGDKIRIIGVSREKEETVTEWLKTEREEGVTWDQTVAYSLAMDGDEVMTRTYFRAAGRRGIPSAFLVGKDGIIEWIGHPARIDEPLAKVTDGTWDREVARNAYDAELKEMKAQAELTKVQRAISAAVREKNWDAALALVDEQIEKAPDNLMLKMMKLSVLSQSEKADEAGAMVQELVKADWEKGSVLGPLALGIAMKRYPGTLDEAERIAKHALELHGGKDFALMHTLAKVCAEKGQIDDAIAWERKALELAENHPVILRTLREYESQKEASGKAAEGVKPEKSEMP
jgi:thiol-disulfide isomerase/thioredoxin